jgi:tetratricopeptide (TPR) repeat protein
MNFVEGRDLFRNYLGSGRGDDLVRARESLSEAERNDPEFALATFYLAVVENELRDADSAISRLESLARRQVYFLPETYLQLAYAHTKKYRDSDYFEAEASLDRALEQAKTSGRRDLVPLIEAYRTFLFSVMGGRLRQGDIAARELYLRKAIKLGEHLLRMDTRWRLPVGRMPEDARREVLFEIRNALGIAYMRKGQQADPFSASQQHDWKRAVDHYEQALKLRPNATRVMQNIGTLRLLEGDQFFRNGRPEEATLSYRAAQEAYRRSLDLNPHDQFPHYRMAGLAARLGDWDAASRFCESGILEKGSVNEETWERMRRAIRSGNVADLLSND